MRNNGDFIINIKDLDETKAKNQKHEIQTKETKNAKNVQENNTRKCRKCKEEYKQGESYLYSYGICVKCEVTPMHSCECCGNDIYPHNASRINGYCYSCYRLGKDRFPDIFKKVGFRVYMTFQLSFYCNDNFDGQTYVELDLPMISRFKYTDIRHDGIIIGGPVVFYETMLTTKRKKYIFIKGRVKKMKDFHS